MLSALRTFFKDPTPAEVNATYIALLQQARNPFFYAQCGVPDTIDGRFEMLTLHLFLVQHRLLHEPAHAEFARGLSEALFRDMDRSIRELGVADTGVGKRIKAMGKAYNGRLQAYEAGLTDPEAMRAALARNLFGTVAEGQVAQLDAMAQYMTTQLAALAATPVEDVVSGRYDFKSDRRP